MGRGNGQKWIRTVRNRKRINMPKTIIYTSDIHSISISKKCVKMELSIP
ncbi:MAG: hypothetical protein V1768_02350 [Patescibacteria group bacterium]|nr:hypothetical protein [Patescibacteria group bacterium]MBU1987619.1 hypothetical protein [Patescibacteria group bacterium]MBU2474731.1 hypothetical protein [Patescibacteria group bacterium]